MENKQLPALPETNNAATEHKPKTIMRPMFRIVPAHNEATSNKENQHPASSMRKHRHRIRHHNPGTHYRPDPRLHRHPNKRIRLVSSILVRPPTVAPPADHAQPSTSRGCGRHTSVHTRPKITEIQEKWHKPRVLELDKIKSIWRKERALVPTPTTDYRYGFDIKPGPAYQPVVWYEDQDAKWPPRRLNVPEPSRPKMHDAQGMDPRSLDLRVRLNRLHLGDLRNHLNKKREIPPEVVETPEQAVAHLHGETYTPPPTKTQEKSTPERTNPTPDTTMARPQNNPWPTPGRRRRRCRLVIIYDAPENKQD